MFQEQESKEKAALRAYLAGLTKHKYYFSEGGNVVGFFNNITYLSKKHLDIHARLLLLGCKPNKAESGSKYDLVYNDEPVVTAYTYKRQIRVMQLQ